jgi:large subunit ribosomal protein L19
MNTTMNDKDMTILKDENREVSNRDVIAISNTKKQEVAGEKKKRAFSFSLLQQVEEQYLRPDIASQISIGDIIRLGYQIREGEKERVQYYEGLVIAKQNKGLGQSFTLRRSVQGIGVEQMFFTHSPKILSITKKQASKVRRAKLYFIRHLTGKATK